MFINAFLISLLFIFSLLSPYFLNVGENSYLEHAQELILISGILIHLRFRKLFIKYSNKLLFSIRLSIFAVLLFEEISYVTEGKNDFFKFFNKQSEINFHNSNFMYGSIFENINFSFLNLDFKIELYIIIYFLSLLFLGYGSYLPTLKNFKIIFLERKYSGYTWIFILNRSINFILDKTDNLNYLVPIIYSEFVELFLYILILLDTINKVYIFKRNTKSTY